MSSFNNIVACRAVTKRRPQDMRIYNRCFLGKHITTETDGRATIQVLLETGCFYVVRTEELEGWQLGRWSQFWREDLRAEAEESPLLEAVTRELPVKTQQAGNGLAGVVMICELWRSPMALWLLIVPSRVYKWSINTFTNRNPVSIITSKSWRYETSHS
jgi:hypothetical protein